MHEDKTLKWQDEFDRLVGALPPEKQPAFRICMSEMRRAIVENCRVETFVDDFGNLPKKGGFSMGKIE